MREVGSPSLPNPISKDRTLERSLPTGRTATTSTAAPAAPPSFTFVDLFSLGQESSATPNTAQPLTESHVIGLRPPSSTENTSVSVRSGSLQRRGRPDEEPDAVSAQFAKEAQSTGSTPSQEEATAGAGPAQPNETKQARLQREAKERRAEVRAGREKDGIDHKQLASANP